MPNYCDFEMKVKGSKTTIARVLKCMNTDYNYSEGKPSHKHFFRVFQADKSGEPVKNEDGTYTQVVYGYCAWSVSSCMLDGNFSYYDSVKKNHPEIFMGTTLAEQSKDCTIEVFSEEPGMCFSEHYIFKNGECLCSDECEITSGGYDENGQPTEDIDWDEYGGDTIVFNPYRFGRTGDFLWCF